MRDVSEVMPGSHAAGEGGRLGLASFAAVALVALLWLLTTVVFWVGYVGTDDMFYARYAHLLHRTPINWWEFRIPLIVAMRGSFLAFGPSELAAALPTLLASLAILASVAWFVGWPRKLDWRTNLSMVLAATVPMDVALRSVPGAPYFAAGFLALGTVCLLRGTRKQQYLAALLFAVGFITHEVSFFYVAILCFTVLAFDRHRYWRPVLACVVVSGFAVLIEGVAYQSLMGDAMARYKTSAATTANLAFADDPWAGVSGIRFFTWPLETVLFSKSFGIDLLLLFAGGALAWRRLVREQRMLLTAVVLTWAWYGYGTQVPWAYKPLYRQMHYYGPLVLGVAALVPTVVSHALAARRALAPGILAAAVSIHFVCLAGSGRWGEDVEVSRRLLWYAERHPGRLYVTDVATMNHIYTLRGFRLPENVVCLNGRGVERDLLLNKEPVEARGFRFPELPVDGVLVNLERLDRVGAEAEFLRSLELGFAERVTVAPERQRMLFAPLLAFFEPRDFMLRSRGGEARYLRGGPLSIRTEPVEASGGGGH